MIIQNKKNRFSSKAGSDTLCINVLNPPADIALVKKAAQTALRSEGIIRADLTLYFVSDLLIRRLNRKYLSKNSSTDVLAFDLNMQNGPKGRLSGDVVVCIDTARSVAKELAIPFKEELCRYVIHGVLHLVGYDDLSVRDRRKMWKRQEYLLKKCIA